MHRIKQIYFDIFKTRILNSSKGLYIIKYITQKFFALLRKMVGFGITPRPIRGWLSKNKFIIENKIGQFQVDITTDSVTKSSPLFEKKTQHWITSIEKNGIFLDIGANIGFYTILALRYSEMSKAIGFEPNPQVYCMLKKNIDLNKVNARAVNAAVGNRNGTLELEQKNFHTGAGKITNSNSKDRTTVNSLRFDDYMQEQDIDPGKIALIKIDVEGHEEKVLAGMQNTLEKVDNSVYLFIEIWPENKSSIVTRLNDFGFSSVSKTNKNYLFKKNG